MTPGEIRQRILSQTTEDYTGLWELAAVPEAPELDELVAELSALVRRNLVAVYQGTTFSSEELQLPAAAAQQAIRDPAFWQWSAPERGSHLRALATPAGRAWYFGQTRRVRTNAAE